MSSEQRLQVSLPSAYALEFRLSLSIYCLHVCRYFFSVFSLVVLPVFIFFGFDVSLNTACQDIPLFSVPRRIGVYLRGIFFEVSLFSFLSVLLKVLLC